MSAREDTARTEPAQLGLDGRVALVTGAARGLGRAIAHQLCAAGCDVYVNYHRDDDSARQTIEELAGLKGTAVAVRADVRDGAAFHAVLDQVAEERGGLDVFVHNAATFRYNTAVGPDPESFRSELELALNPLLSGGPRLAELMAGRPGRIIVVSSNGAHSVIPGYVNVGVAKAAVENLVRYLAVELAGRGISVNAVATALLDKGELTANRSIAEFLGRRTPAGRLSTPCDVAEFVTLLATDQAAWLQGQVITVDGGLGLLA
ncbi:SDR family oxidoreductase [Streptomyces canus]|uniref:SDR family oxidoreductase n=1 Tax=Streptomyces canus TaxID=58343 RepID=UPI00224D4061|nr:SDR family oxidoreductase [Streptomyces canus]MCX5261957.1 SDR family oxidoreductase [Streptomyces canus]